MDLPEYPVRKASQKSNQNVVKCKCMDPFFSTLYIEYISFLWDIVQMKASNPCNIIIVGIIQIIWISRGVACSSFLNHTQKLCPLIFYKLFSSIWEFILHVHGSSFVTAKPFLNLIWQHILQVQTFCNQTKIKTWNTAFSLLWGCTSNTHSQTDYGIFSQ